MKRFGQQMVDAHTKTTDELTGIVKSKNIKVDLPANLDAKHQKLIDDLNSASPRDFDKTYAKQQVDGHQEAVHLFKKYAAKGDDADVKQFGQQMVDAHTKTTEDLTGIVKSKNIKVDLPTKLDAKHQKLIDDLNSASAQDFNKTYANQQVDAHQEAVDLFKKYASSGDDADVTQFAEKTLPTIEHHLEGA